jgi:hypothetical protein
MTTPKYLEAFRRAAREAETHEKNIAFSKPQTREKSEVSEKSGGSGGGGGGLNSLTSLISPSELPKNVCAVCNAPKDLWHVGDALVHQECARFLPKPELAEPSAAYQATSAEPDGTACKVEIIELPQAGRYRKVFGVLQLRPPAYIPEDRWRRAIADGRAFLQQWGETAQRLGWTSADLFGLHAPPAKPHPSYSRLSRYDCTGLCWLLQGRPVVALTEATAAIENPTGAVTVYRKHNKPALGPLGDSLDDFK